MVRKGVFTITNKKTGKKYIGSSNINLDQLVYRSWQKLKAGTFHNTELQKDFNKYGSSNFDIMVTNHYSKFSCISDIDSIIDSNKWNLYKPDIIGFPRGNPKLNTEEINKTSENLLDIINNYDLKEYDKEKVKNQVKEGHILTKEQLINKIEYYLSLSKQNDEKTIEKLRRKAKSCIEKKEYKFAIRCYDKLIKLDPTNEEYEIKRQELLKEIDYDILQRQKFKLAVETTDKAIKLEKREELDKAMPLYEEAIECYNQLIKINPKPAEYYTNKGSCLFKLEKYEEAIECCDKAIELNPNDKIYYTKGSCLFKLEKYEEAIQCFDKAIELQPRYNSTYPNIKAICCMRLNLWEEALHCLNKAIELDKYNYTYYHSRATCLKNLGQFEEAKKCYDKSAELQEEFEKRKAKEYYQIALHQISWHYGSDKNAENKLYDAVDFLKKATSLDLENTHYTSRYHHYKAEYLRRFGHGQYEEAITHYDTAIFFDPNYADCYYFKAICLGELGEYDEILKLYDKAISANPNEIWPYIKKAYCLEKLGQFEEAKKCYDKSAELQEEFEKQKAKEYYQEALRLIPSFGFSRYNYKSMKFFKKAMSLDPENTLYQSRYHFCVASKNMDSGKYEEAIVDYDKAISFDPNYAEYYYFKVHCLIQLEKYEGAIKYCDKAIELQPTVLSYYEQKISCLGMLGKYDEILKLCDKAISANPDETWPYMKKAYCLETLGKYEEAIKCCDKSIEIDSTYSKLWSKSRIIQYKGYRPFTEYPHAHELKVKCLEKLGRLKEAIKYYDKTEELKQKHRYNGVVID